MLLDPFKLSFGAIRHVHMVGNGKNSRNLLTLRQKNEFMNYEKKPAH